MEWLQMPSNTLMNSIESNTTNGGFCFYRVCDEKGPCSGYWCIMLTSPT